MANSQGTSMIGYYGPFDYGLDDYAGPYYDDSDSFDVEPAPSDVAPDGSASLIMSVQAPGEMLRADHPSKLLKLEETQ
jgi:hypothetical protein